MLSDQGCSSMLTMPKGKSFSDRLVRVHPDFRVVSATLHTIAHTGVAAGHCEIILRVLSQGLCRWRLGYRYLRLLETHWIHRFARGSRSVMIAAPLKLGSHGGAVRAVALTMST